MRSISQASVLLALLSWPTAAFAGPCADGGWGHIGDPDGSLHVASDGDDGASGQATAPLATLYEAVARSRSTGLAIALHPGVHDASLLLDQRDDGLTVAGCGAGQSLLVPPTSDDFVFDVAAAEGLKLAGLGLVGGKDALKVRDGAKIEAEYVDVEDAKGAAVKVEGEGSEVVWTGGTVEGTEEHEGDAAAFDVEDGRLELIDAELLENIGKAVWVKGGELVVEETTILATLLTAAGLDGDAIVAEEGASLLVQLAELSGNEGSAVKAIDALNAWMENISVTVPTTGMTDALVLNADATVINVQLD